MADIKSRRPYRLSDTDYDDWFSNWVAWFLAFPNTPEFANWLRAGVNPFDADYHDKRITTMEAKNEQDAATKMWNQAVKNLRQILVKLRISLPTLTPGDDSVLDTLILRNVYLRAIAHWGTDDFRLLELGMVHKFGIWTMKKKPETKEE